MAATTAATTTTMVLVAAQFLQERSGSVIVVKNPQVLDVVYKLTTPSRHEATATTGDGGAGEGFSDPLPPCSPQQVLPSNKSAAAKTAVADGRCCRFRCLQVRHASTVLVDGRPLTYLANSTANEIGLLKLATFDQ